MRTTHKIPLSAPHLDGIELALVQEAFASNWIAPLGPQVDAFEQEFCQLIDAPAALATSSGTAALHLALMAAGVGPGDEVLVSTLTFIASVNPIRYLGAHPTFIDSERSSWNLDPNLVAAALEERAKRGRPPKAVIAVHLYGQTADLEPIGRACREHGVTLIEDAAEALGARHHDRAAGTIGRLGIFSFNGNKIITTSGGGMLVAGDPALIERARKLATQAREPVDHYEHREIGYNYRLSNLLAAVGRGQLKVLADRVAARRRNFDLYRAGLGDLAGLELMPEAPWGLHSRWLTTVLISPERFGADCERVRRALLDDEIEARRLWKPMHQQPAFRGMPVVGGAVADDLFDRGLCLPSGSTLTPDDIERIVAVIRSVVM